MMSTVKPAHFRFCWWHVRAQKKKKKKIVAPVLFFPYPSRVVETFMRCLATQCKFSVTPDFCPSINKYTGGQKPISPQLPIALIPTIAVSSRNRDFLLVIP